MKSKIYKYQNKYLKIDKTFFLVLATLLISISSFAQQGINYKALIKDNSGNVLSSQSVGVQFQIREAWANGIAVYTETHPATTDINGILVLNIGTGTTSDTFSAIDWSSKHWLNVQIDITGGTNYTDMSTTQFMTVPYALSAANVSGLEKITESTFSEGTPIYGWRLRGKNPNNYAPIGAGAVDLSNSVFPSDVSGASGIYSTALGNGTQASGHSSTAMGSNNDATGDYSTAMGAGTDATGEYSIAIGFVTEASGDSSTAMGRVTTAPSFGETVLGAYNTPYTPNSSTEWVNNDRLFTVGNGTGNSSRSNALTILKNGRVGLGRSNPSSLLEVAHQSSPPTTSNYTNAFSIHNMANGRSWQLHTANSDHLNLYRNGSYRGYFHEATGVYSSISDRRTKREITPMENGTLNKVMQLNPVSYLMKDQTGTKRNLGLISQEVQEIFPIITTYVEESDLIALSYTELIPILIKALQEQQSMIDTQNSKLETFENQMATFSKRLENIEAANN
ncbi:tail fiber domain-containing protein [Winogradskyella forsetii]|uniref:tail fiber domain-containing protein n=1 Tax=Winogradskyella forsetii TaxID=2686077 RepID=UPI0015BB3F51|nr:tail fiber domain-containing protein [Winogradskyella forsetii]